MLSRRERQVLDAVGLGLTYAKLDVGGRTAAAALAAQAARVSAASPGPC